jgi:hypothetical protein
MVRPVLTGASDRQDCAAAKHESQHVATLVSYIDGSEGWVSSIRAGLAGSGHESPAIGSLGRAQLGREVRNR